MQTIVHIIYKLIIIIYFKYSTNKAHLCNREQINTTTNYLIHFELIPFAKTLN